MPRLTPETTQNLGNYSLHGEFGIAPLVAPQCSPYHRTAVFSLATLLRRFFVDLCVGCATGDMAELCV